MQLTASREAMSRVILRSMAAGARPLRPAFIERGLELDPAVRLRLGSALRDHLGRTAEGDDTDRPLMPHYRELACLR